MWVLVGDGCAMCMVYFSAEFHLHFAFSSFLVCNLKLLYWNKKIIFETLRDNKKNIIPQSPFKAKFYL